MFLTLCVIAFGEKVCARLTSTLGMSDTSLKPIVDIDTTRYQSIPLKFNTSVVTASLTSVVLF